MFNPQTPFSKYSHMNSEELFKLANKQLVMEKEAVLTPATQVNFECTYLTNGDKCYSISIFFDEAGKTIGQTSKHCQAYTHVGIPSIKVENGFCSTNTIAPFPLIDGYVRQHMNAHQYLVTIKVSKVKMDVSE